MTATTDRRLPLPTATPGARARLAVLRAGFGALERTSPRLAARAGVRLWTKLPDTRGRRRDLRPSPGAVVRVRNPRGTEIAVESWGDPTAAPVYLVHGWGGWRGQLGGLVTPLLERGHRVVAFDAPSHGDSAPGVLGNGRGSLPESLEALEAVGGVFGPAAGIVAHSMGCAATAAVVHEGRLTARRLVLIAPSHDVTDMVTDLVRLLGLGESTRAAMRDRIETFARRPITSFDLAPMGTDGTLPPTLVVHDRLDKETPHSVGLSVAESWPETELLTTNGLGHQRILADDLVQRAVADFLSP